MSANPKDLNKTSLLVPVKGGLAEHGPARSSLKAEPGASLL